MTVLIATPIRATTPARISELHEAYIKRLTYADVERVVWPNSIAPTPGIKYQPNATARNEFIERFLKPEHDWVLWMDADIIDGPDDLIERLMKVSLRYGEGVEAAIAAPMVWMERIADGPIGIQNGGWFYDTGGFVDVEGSFADFRHGVAGSSDYVDMLSVGCVYIVPADLYRQGLRYRPVGDEVEHLSFCRVATMRGTRIIAVRPLNVIHAYLPRYGESWH